MDQDPLYINCPGINGYCGELIPAVVQCTGKNAPLKYRRCHVCPYFRWLRTNDYGVLIPTSRRPSPSLSPSLGSSTWPPTGGSTLGSSPTRLLQPTGTPSTWPTTGSSHTPAFQPLPFLPPPPTSSPAPTPAPPATQTKTMCATAGCPRQCLSAVCSSRCCKQCCMQRNAMCQYKGHNTNNSRAVATPTEPYKLATPLPKIPLDLDPSLEPLPELFDLQSNGASLNDAFQLTSLSAHVFRKPLAPEWEADHDRKVHERDARKEALASKTKHELLLQHQVILWAWTENGQSPRMRLLQGIKTWDTLDLSTYPGIPMLLGVNSLDGYELYNPDFHFWMNVTVMRVKTNQAILLRAPGVTDCPEMDNAFSRPSGNRSKRAASPTTPPRPTGKRARVKGAPPPSPLPPSSPPLSISSSPSSSPAPPSRQRLASPEPVVPSGSVRVPSVACGSWPRGMYAADMAEGFRLMALRPSQTSVEDHFKVVFSGATFKKSTYYVHQKLWNQLPETKKMAAIKCARDATGLWSVFT